MLSGLNVKLKTTFNVEMQIGSNLNFCWLIELLCTFAYIVAFQTNEFVVDVNY